ncbi:hypothetical protein E2C01_059746 [Portunus trituberculatus]|uniref:Uncharacterized protein n=1 Tax=Portunus trituberculatus TaxID=210409 RepID=A0A5B7H9A5_PORTR|nr:hypothetical protein [Portunus trituberculatus]
MSGVSVGVSKLLSRLSKVLYVQCTWYSTLHSGTDCVSIYDLCSFPSKFKKSLKSFGQNWLRVVTALGAARGEKVAVGSGLGPKAGNWQQVFLFLGGLQASL